jgi:hypothetical protein
MGGEKRGIPPEGRIIIFAKAIRGEQGSDGIIIIAGIKIFSANPTGIESRTGEMGCPAIDADKIFKIVRSHLTLHVYLCMKVSPR